MTPRQRIDQAMSLEMAGRVDDACSLLLDCIAAARVANDVANEIRAMLAMFGMITRGTVQVSSLEQFSISKSDIAEWIRYCVAHSPTRYTYSSVAGACAHIDDMDGFRKYAALSRSKDVPLR